MPVRKLYILILLFLLSEPVDAQNKYVYVENGTLYHPDGRELSLWGLNLQPCLSWEWNSLLKRVGVPWNANEWTRITEVSLDEMELMKCQVVRCHLTPADFTDAEGNLVQTIYLDMLDYMVAESKKRGMYLYLAFINHMNNWAIENSFINGPDREMWIQDEDIVGHSMNYITQLLNRTNPYTDQTYSADTAFAVWEIINEPGYYSYEGIQSTKYNSVFTQ